MIKTRDLRLNGILYRIVVEGPHTPAERLPAEKLYIIERKNGIWYRKPA